jgi:carbamate kinase
MTNGEGRLVVVALGGNALMRAGEKGTISEQEKNSADTCRHILSLVKRGYSIVITHGNGPQVGAVLLKNELCKDRFPPMPVDVCVSDTQGSIGYILQQALLNELRRNGIRKFVVTMITQVVVNKDDRAFKNPTKPIGPFYDGKRARELMKKNGWSMIEDAGRGWRRVVASPVPVKIIQRDMIKRLADDGHIVIAVGGGGIPIWKKEDGEYEGIEAVIDKDLATAVIASEIRADMMIILTEVPRVYVNFGKPNQKPLKTLTERMAKRYLSEGQFGVGSMKPKIEAALQFIDAVGNDVLITSPECLEKALEGRTGTLVVADSSRMGDAAGLLDGGSELLSRKGDSSLRRS